LQEDVLKLAQEYSRILQENYLADYQGEWQPLPSKYMALIRGEEVVAIYKPLMPSEKARGRKRIEKTVC
jgi:hypothetical protein